MLERRLSSSGQPGLHDCRCIGCDREYLKYGRPFYREAYYGTSEIEEPELADEIRKKMFVFEDILLLDDISSVFFVMLKNSDLGIALKGANEDVQNANLNNLSNVWPP